MSWRFYSRTSPWYSLIELVNLFWSKLEVEDKVCFDWSMSSPQMPRFLADTGTRDPAFAILATRHFKLPPPFICLTHTLHAVTTPSFRLNTMLRSRPAHNAVSALCKPQSCRPFSSTAPTAAISPYRRTGQTSPSKADVVRRGQSTAAATAP